MSFHRKSGYLFILLTFSLLVSCKEDKNPNQETENTDLLNYRSSVLLYPSNQTVTLGDSLPFEIQLTDSSAQIDSMHVLVDELNSNFTTSKSGDQSQGRIYFSVSGSNLKIGSHTLQLKVRIKGKDWEQSSQTFFVSSDIKPEVLTYQVVQTYPHSNTSFTQGLEWFGNRLYEGTGLNGKSTVMEIVPKTGSALQRVALDQTVFGEGITVVNNQLYQISWKNQQGFVYDLPSLKKVKTFSYPTDGWGLTHWQNQLVMTDGGNKLYFLDPLSFKTLGSVEVWDDKNAIDQLNELETVGDAIYANKYTTDTIVKIDPKTGKVLAYIDLKGLLKESDKTGEEDVLNGIAWNADEKLFYLTGKNWPKMFAVRFVSKKNL